MAKGQDREDGAPRPVGVGGERRPIPDREAAPLPPGISAVVPVYNGAETLPELTRRLAPVLSAAAPDWEILLVNDASADGSWSVIEELSRGDDRVRGIDMMRNYGQHNALLCGIRHARYDRTVTLDDDLQNPPEEIPKLLAEIEKGAAVAYGKPEKQQHGLWRGLASTITKIVLKKAMGQQAARGISAFRAFETRLREAFRQYSSPFVSIDVLLTWGTSRFVAIPVRHEPRQAGTSGYTMRKLVLHALNMLTGFSTLPLRLASIVGFATTLFGVGLLVYVVGRYLIEGGSVPGFPFLASAISIFSGAQLFALGILGEYLGRIHLRMMDRPTYTVGRVTRRDDARGSR